AVKQAVQAEDYVCREEERTELLALLRMRPLMVAKRVRRIFRVFSFRGHVLAVADHVSKRDVSAKHERMILELERVVSEVRLRTERNTETANHQTNRRVWSVPDFAEQRIQSSVAVVHPRQQLRSLFQPEWIYPVN